jgi:hypothetical protein
MMRFLLAWSLALIAPAAVAQQSIVGTWTGKWDNDPYEIELTITPDQRVLYAYGPYRRMAYDIALGPAQVTFTTKIYIPGQKPGEARYQFKVMGPDAVRGSFTHESGETRSGTLRRER